jgi:hypothetical protein
MNAEATRIYRERTTRSELCRWDRWTNYRIAKILLILQIMSENDLSSYFVFS